MSLVLLFLTLIASCLSVSQGQCSNNGIIYEGFSSCACFSGYSGEDCSIFDELPECSNLLPVSSLTTEAIAELRVLNEPRSRVVEGALDLYVDAYSRNKRVELLALAQNISCGYPEGPFTKEFVFQSEQCRDRFNALIPLGALVECGFDMGEEADFYTLSGSVDMIAIDDLGTFRGMTLTRETVTSTMLSIRAPRLVTVSTSNLNVVSPIDLQAFVTQQFYDSEQDQVVVVLTTSVQYPYVLSNPSIESATPPDQSALGPCDFAPERDDCFQETTMIIQNFGSICQLIEESYTFTWNYGCLPGFTPCPVAPDATTSVVATISTDITCGTVNVDANIQGQINTFTDSSFTVETSNFVVGGDVFLRADFNADVPVAQVTVTRVSVDGASIELGAVSILPEVRSGTLDFTFQITEAMFPDLGDNAQSFVIECTFDIQYSTNFKREIVSSSFYLSKTIAVHH